MFKALKLFKLYVKEFLIWLNKNYTKLLLGKDYDLLFNDEKNNYV